MHACCAVLLSKSNKCHFEAFNYASLQNTLLAIESPSSEYPPALYRLYKQLCLTCRWSRKGIYVAGNRVCLTAQLI